MESHGTDDPLPSINEMVMKRGRHEFGPGIWADWRRAIWFEEAQVLAVADLHLGYAWAQRHRGQLIPVASQGDLKRIRDLGSEYQPREVVLLGDIVHRALPIKGVDEELKALLDIFSGGAKLNLLAGNHDRHLGKLIGKYVYPVRLAEEFRAGPHLLLHGDRAVNSHPLAGGRTFIGHEHPAIRLGDGVSTAEKFPCFLVSDDLVILPAFSSWAAGTAIGTHPFMSEIAQRTTFTEALAILGERILPVRLG